MLVAIGLVVGAAGVFMAVVIPAAGWPQSVVVGSFGLLFLVALGKGFLHVRAGRVALHREWMIRAFALGLSIATQCLISIPALLIVTTPTDGQVATLVIVSFTVAFVLHASVAEIWIRTTRNLQSRRRRAYDRSSEGEAAQDSARGVGLHGDARHGRRTLEKEG